MVAMPRASWGAHEHHASMSWASSLEDAWTGLSDRQSLSEMDRGKKQRPLVQGEHPYARLTMFLR